MKRILARTRRPRVQASDRIVAAAVPLSTHELSVGPSMASGGMATVCLGLYGVAPVAIKRLHPHLAGLPEMVATLRDEVRIGGWVRHPNVLAPLSLYGDPIRPVLLSPYVHGEARVAPALALRIALDVLAGLDAAHRATDEAGRPLSLVHRDVTPHNILVGVDGVSRVIDFGIARCKTRFQTTKAGDVKGKFPYLAPEQLRGDDATPPTDIYAFAAVLWEMLAGRRLFDGEHEASVIAEVLAGRVPRISGIVPDLPSELGLVFARALSREPGHRYSSATAMAYGLRGAGRIASAREVGDWVGGLARSSLYERELALVELVRLRRTCFVYKVEREPSCGGPAIIQAIQAARPSEATTRRRAHERGRAPAGMLRRDVLAVLLSCIFFGIVCTLAARGVSGKANIQGPVPESELRAGSALDVR